MPIALNVVSRKKLILVRQLYQRAIVQAEIMHSDVDRIMAVITLDLANETLLKAVVSEVAPRKRLESRFHELVDQADLELANAALPQIHHVVEIKRVHDIRNDAQHKVKYPNDSEVNDCRTYTRDFLRQITLDVWGEQFESISLVDVIQNSRVKGYLVEAEQQLAKGDYNESVIKCVAAFGWTISSVKASIVGRMPHNASAILMSDGFGKPIASREMFQVFNHMRDTIMRSLIGISFPGYLEFSRITNSFKIAFFGDGGYSAAITGGVPTLKEAEYVLEFATNTILQIESLVGDIERPFDI